MATTVLNVPEQGQLVRVRSRQWVVNEVKPSKLPPPAMKPSFDGAHNLITLSSVEDDGLGEELQVVWEVEPGATVIEKVALPEPTDFDHPNKLDVPSWMPCGGEFRRQEMSYQHTLSRHALGQR